MEAQDKGFTRREFNQKAIQAAKVAAGFLLGAASTLDCFLKPKEDSVYEFEICKMEIEFRFKEGSDEHVEVSYTDLANEPLYAVILDQGGLIVGYAILIIPKPFTQPINIAFGQTLTIQVYKGLSFDLCEVEEVTIPDKNDFEALGKLNGEPIPFDSDSFDSPEELFAYLRERPEIDQVILEQNIEQFKADLQLAEEMKKQRQAILSTQE